MSRDALICYEILNVAMKFGDEIMNVSMCLSIT